MINPRNYEAWKATQVMDLSRNSQVMVHRVLIVSSSIALLQSSDQSSHWKDTCSEVTQENQRIHKNAGTFFCMKSH